MKRFGSTNGWALALALILLLPAVGFGQEVTGSIAGTVFDASNATIPGASIEVSGSGLPRALTTVSDSTGAYAFQSVPAGIYTLTATATGFTSMKQTGINVVLGRAARVDFKMAVGAVAETVTVTGDAVMVDTSSTASAVTVDKTFFDQLPKGRAFYDLINLAPGARNETKTGGYQIDGASGSENTYYIDGMEVTNVQTGVLADANKVPVEAVQQVQVKNGVMDAQWGGAMGGVVNAVIRNGTNEFHGQAGFYFDNDAMSAHPRPTLELDPNDPTQNTVRYFQNAMDDYSTWNPVFSVGGPILKDKLFFFSGYMPTLTNSNRTVTFLSNNQTSDFARKDRQQYVINKVDFAPVTKIRTSMSWVWNPSYNRGVLPARQGTGSPDTNYAGQGEYQAGNILSGQIDYIATNKLLFSFRGGYHFRNDKTGYALSPLTALYYSNGNTMFTDIPADLQRSSASWLQQSVAKTNFDVYQRVNLSADGSYLANWQGQHNLKFGWMINQLSNNVSRLDYPNGYYRFYWDQAYSCVTSQCSGKNRGKYGYYRWYTYGTLGDASSENQGFYLQDSWRMNRNLTLNLGIRFEREFLPSFSKAGVEAAPPIEFGWGSKISPRIGAAWDPKGNGKMRIYGSYGEFYDVMKYELPRGSFGGDTYFTSFYSIDDPNVVNTLRNWGYPSDPTKLPGTRYETINWRIPSNDPNDNTVDPNLKPMKQRMLDLGYDYSINPTLVASVRYTNRRLVRTIEDVGTLTPAGEIYFIANPGEGVVADPKSWEPGYPTTPKAIRHYDAVEVRLDQRFSRNYQYAASYTWSRQTGNYSGLASSDENGRTSPNVNRYFDVPWLAYTEKGVMANGVLATDRPHTFKLFGGYTLNSKLGGTTLAPSVMLWSGIPLTTEINAISTTPVYPYNRGDMGRTPMYFNTNFNLIHEFKPFSSNEALRLRVELTVFNLFNNSSVTNQNSVLLHADDGQLQFESDTDIFKGFNTKQLMQEQDRRVNPLYKLDSAWQKERGLRLQVAFFF